jgi:hypothetical protein
MLNERDRLHIVVESMHTGTSCSVHASPQATLSWLLDEALRGLELSGFKDTEVYARLRVRFVLIDMAAMDRWYSLPRESQRLLRVIVKTEDGLLVSENEHDRLSELGMYDHIVFCLRAVEGPEP